MGVRGRREPGRLILKKKTIRKILLHKLFQNGAIRGTLLALQFMGKDKGGQGGVVINIGSAASARPQISTPIYTATKHALLGLSRSCGVSKRRTFL